MHCPQLIIKVAICQIPKIFVTVVLGPGRDFTALLALYFTADLVCCETGFASVPFSLCQGTIPYHLRCSSVTYVLSNSSQNRCLKAFWKATVYNRDPNTESQHWYGKLPVFFILSNVKICSGLSFYIVLCLASVFSTVKKECKTFCADEKL